MPHQSTDPATQSTAPNTSRDGNSDTDGSTGADAPLDSSIHVLEELPSLPLDQVFEVLKNERRRRVLEQLSGADDALDLGTLAEEIAALENDKHVRQITSTERKRVYVGLYQCHLPKMDELGVVSFEKSRGTIEAGPHIDAVLRYLETPTQASPSSEERTPLVLSATGAVALAAALAVQPMTTLPVLDVAVWGLIVAFIVHVVVGLYTVRTEGTSEPHGRETNGSKGS
jgi:hypothetical protein